nr:MULTISPECIES: H-NS histone family protein [unclassified Acidovorax]
MKRLLAARAELEAKIAQARSTEAKDALAQIHAWVEEFGFTAQQVFPWKAPTTKKVAAKYLDEKSGATWTGRGKPPAWIQGKDRAAFLIEKPTQQPEYRAPLLAEMAAAAHRNQRR